VTAFKSQKVETEAKKMWDLFYKRNSINFFKDRHWTFREFQELNLIVPKVICRIIAIDVYFLCF